ncbi:unannotated protein [freshwater metagenome]|uniref:Unannotated protein n=1 Tax=freshwater metagenome TaxID=449393 RepID=A0A6J7W8I3_9ZZZZ|nr:hypothetical protein [Actinomycetota bacterium]MSW63057.1 hypothetical protein [Actinomycetota bacterium]MSX90105.1 hypothetical protein [Actinomycetota bacterium]MSZ63815.1 hypothetical protein [Actinomycetota bacterium]MTA58384.1 hypothetical protein [Actinomycetota bacterium]
MFGRVLGSTLTQVLRSIALILLPTSFIALIAWATAGSATGNTGDPMRAVLWIWLGAHQIPFTLSLPPANTAGLLSYLPLGALLFPVLAIRSGVSRTIDRLDGDASLVPLARALFATLYTIIGTLFAFVSTTHAVRPTWYLAPVFLLPIALISGATVGRRLVFGQAILFSTRIISLMLGVASIVFGVSIFINLSTVRNLSLVLEPGIIGGFLLLILNILYIPNAVVATLGYFSGVGFAVGSGSIISPFSFHLHSIPAFPLLGALPSATSRLGVLGIGAILLSGALLTNWTIALSTRVLIQSLFASLLIIVAIAYAGSGALITDAMSAMGVSPWKFTLALAGELTLGALIALYLPRLGKHR